MAGGHRSEPAEIDGREIEVPDNDDGEIIMPFTENAATLLYERIRVLDVDIESELRLQNSTLANEIMARERIGVELYQLQHQLAKFQKNYDSMHSNITQLKLNRKEKEETRTHEEATYKVLTMKLADLDKQIMCQKTEAHKVNNVLRQLDAHNSALHSNLSAMKMVLAKTNTDVLSVEKQKEKQDYYIDSLEAELAEIHEDITLQEYRRNLKNTEFLSLSAAVRDASIEIEAILFEKSQLLKYWKTGLTALERRDHLARQILSTIRMETEDDRFLSLELSSIVEKNRKCGEKIEELAALFGKFENDIRYTEKLLEKINDRRDLQQQSFSVCAARIETIESEHEKILSFLRKEQRSFVSKENELKRLINALQQLELRYAFELQCCASLRKQATGTESDGLKNKRLIFEKQKVLSKQVNDIAHRELEIANYQNRQVEAKKRSLHMDHLIDDENKKIESLQKDLRKQFEEIGRKQSEAENLSRKYSLQVEQLNNAGDIRGEVGPFELAAHNLQKQNQEFDSMCLDLQQQWLKTQNEMTSLSNQLALMENALVESSNRLAVLTRTKSSLDLAIEAERMNVRVVSKSSLELKTDMAKISRLLQQHDETESRHGSNSVEAELRNRLRQIELEKVRLQESAQEVANKCEVTKNEIVALEFEFSLWLRRLELAKQAKLETRPSPEYDSIASQSRDLDRLRQSLTNLKKSRDAIIVLMEQAVHRHSEISTAAMALKAANKTNSNAAALRRNINDVLRQIRSVEDTIAGLISKKAFLIDRLNELAARINVAEHERSSAENVLAKATNFLADEKVKKRSAMSTLLLYQTKAKLWRDCAYVLDTTRDLALQLAKNTATQKYDHLLEVNAKLAENNSAWSVTPLLE